MTSEKGEERKAINRMIRALKERPCKDCKVQYPRYVMEYDHLPGHHKKFNLSQVPSSATISEVLEEIKKCEVVCANCHRLRTYNRPFDKNTGRPRIAFGDAELEQAREMIAESISIREIAKKLNINKSTLHRRLQEVSVSDEELKRLRNEGFSWSEISQKTGVSVWEARTRTNAINATAKV